MALVEEVKGLRAGLASGPPAAMKTPLVGMPACGPPMVS